MNHYIVKPRKLWMYMTLEQRNLRLLLLIIWNKYVLGENVTPIFEIDFMVVVKATHVCMHNCVQHEEVVDINLYLIY